MFDFLWYLLMCLLAGAFAGFCILITWNIHPGIGISVAVFWAIILANSLAKN